MVPSRPWPGIVALVLGALVACAPVHVAHDTLRVALGDDPGVVDPATGYNVPAWSVDKLLFDSLVDYDAYGRIVPDLAATWSVGVDSIKFKLRRGLRFSDGAPCTAADVVASMDRLLAPATRCPVPRFYSAIAGADDVIASKATHISGLSAPDPITIDFRLSHRDPFLLQVLAMPFCSVLPHGRIDPRHPAGTGPFALTRWIHGQEMIFDRTRPVTRRGQPRRVLFLLGLNEQVEALKFERGELDLLGVHRQIDSADFVRLRNDPKWKARLVSAPEMVTYYVGMNTEMPPFDDVRVRRAVGLAIDRQHLVQLMNGRAEVASGFLPPGLPGLDHDRADGGVTAAALRDVARSRVLLARAGHPTGIDATYYCSNSAASVKLATAIEQDVAAAGIRLTLEPLAFPSFLTAVGRRRNVAIFQGDWVADYPDPSNFLVPLFSKANIQDANSRNTTFFDDPAYEALLVRAAAEPSVARREQGYHKAEAELLAQLPVVPLFHPVFEVLAQPWVHGFRIHPIWPLDFWDLCLGSACQPEVSR